MEKIALFSITSLSAFGIWSAMNSSVFTVREFVKDEKAAKDTRHAMALGLGLCITYGLSIYMIFKDWVSGLAPIITGIALFLLYEYELAQKGL